MEAAVEHAREMVAAGVDIIDVGGQSTRPHAARLPPEVELQRVMPVIGCVYVCLSFVDLLQMRQNETAANGCAACTSSH